MKQRSKKDKEDKKRKAKDRDKERTHKGDHARLWKKGRQDKWVKETMVRDERNKVERNKG